MMSNTQMVLRVAQMVRKYEQTVNMMHNVSKEDTVLRYFTTLNNYEDDVMCVIDYVATLPEGEKTVARMAKYVVLMEQAKEKLYNNYFEKLAIIL